MENEWMGERLAKDSVKLILASSSPRRRQLLSSLGVDFEAVSPNGDESYEKGLPPQEISKTIAQKKADEIVRLYPDCAVIAADTIVSTGGEVLEKPEDKAHAFEMLKKLSGRWHEVYTGVCVMHKADKSLFFEATKVHFNKLEDDFIDWYISTNEPMDKAGAYGIQGYGAVLVDRIEGDFYNVMGFPIAKIMRELKKLDIYDIGRG
jgi:septum formation protein